MERRRDECLFRFESAVEQAIGRLYWEETYKSFSQFIPSWSYDYLEEYNSISS
jgi:hypothetical protein